MPVNDTDNKMDNSDFHSIARGASIYRKKLPTELWIEISEIVASDDARTLDIWALDVDQVQLKALSPSQRKLFP